MTVTPNSPKDVRRVLGESAPGRILVITICGIVLAEVIAMIVVYFFRHLPYPIQVTLDATIMLVIIFPLLYFLSFKPLLEHIQQRNQVDRIIQVRLRLMQYANTHTVDELLQTTLDEIETLNGSSISFFHFLDDDQNMLSLQAWSTNTLLKMCEAEGKGSHYRVDQAGVWADCIRERRPVIHNDYASLPHRKGMPEGHANVIRELAIPIMRDKKIVAILGMGNKAQDYTDKDVEDISTLADLVWDIVESKRAEDALRKSEEKFRTLVDWTYDWEKWLDPHGDIVYMSPSCERITGYCPADFMANPDLLVQIVHPDDQQRYIEHHQVLHDEIVGPLSIEYRIIARDGSEHWIDHVCRPLFDPSSRYLGRRVSNREITERKRVTQEIVEHNKREARLTQTIYSIQTDIARDLHDTIGQNISYLRMNLENISEGGSIDQKALQTRVQSMIKAADESYELIRTMLAVLQENNSTDPLHLFSRYADQVSNRSPLAISLTNQGNPRPLSPRQMRQLFYIFREALNNIEKYAKASRVTGAFIWEENGLTFRVVDDGCGFLPDQIPSGDHYGLKFMRQRAELLNGSFTIQSTPDKGTIIMVDIPYDEEHRPLSQ